jgi:hypothetical protein
VAVACLAVVIVGLGLLCVLRQRHKTVLDILGHPHSEALRIQERFHRRDFGHIDLSLTIDDPKMYTRPFTVDVTEVLIPDSDILEFVCNENEKDRVHLEKQ